jgi:hypothetical protein
VLAQHHQGQVTVPRLVAQLRGIGVSISKRQVMRLLIAGQDGFLTEARDVLRVGLETAAWISVDDTGARHAGKNGFCTQIGNDDFTWFGTRPSKSRLNFLDLLRAGHTDYVINQAALDYMRGRALAGARDMANGMYLLDDTTLKSIVKATAKGKLEPKTYGDGGGLYLQVAATGASWLFRFTRAGTRRVMGLGDVDAVSLATARSKAAEQRALVAQGVDDDGRHSEDYVDHGPTRVIERRHLARRASGPCRGA